MSLKGKKNQSLKPDKTQAELVKMVTKKEMPSRTARHTAYQDYDLVASNAQSIIDSIDAGMPSSDRLFMQADADSAAAKNKQPAAALLSAVAPSYRRLPQEIPRLHIVVSVLLLLSAAIDR
jgi:hypothetical protein